MAYQGKDDAVVVTITKEAIEAQQGEAIASYQKQVRDLKQEIQFFVEEIHKKKNDLAALDEAIVKTRAAADFELSQKRKELLEEQDLAYKEIDGKREELILIQRSLQDQISAFEVNQFEFRKQQEELNEIRAQVNALKNEYQTAIRSLSGERAYLDQREANIRDDETLLLEKTSAVEKLYKDATDLKAATDAQMKAIVDKRAELEPLLADLEAKTKECNEAQRSLDVTEEERNIFEKAKIDFAAYQEQYKSYIDSLVDRENQIKIGERIIAIERQKLNDRLIKVQELEKKLSGG